MQYLKLNILNNKTDFKLLFQKQDVVLLLTKTLHKNIVFVSFNVRDVIYLNVVIVLFF